MTEHSAQTDCPCGSKTLYQQCCRPLHRGQTATSPEALMRSRYTAFVLGLTDYLRATWHHSTRPDTLTLDDTPDWVSLRVLGSSHTGDAGTVHFRAVYRAGSGWGCLEEASEFVRENGYWCYLRGETREGHLKPGRNDPCPCGSGLKFKVCCL